MFDINRLLTVLFSKKMLNIYVFMVIGNFTILKKIRVSISRVQASCFQCQCSATAHIRCMLNAATPGVSFIQRILINFVLVVRGRVRTGPGTCMLVI